MTSESQQAINFDKFSWCTIIRVPVEQGVSAWWRWVEKTIGPLYTAWNCELWAANQDKSVDILVAFATRSGLRRFELWCDLNAVENTRDIDWDQYENIFERSREL